MEKASLGNSTQEQELLRPIALWAADCAEQALSVFEDRYPMDKRPREAIEGGRAFGHGQKRDKNLRTLAWAAHSASKEADEPSAKYAARAAMLAAAVAYTHTDLPSIDQARHVLGPLAYAMLALEIAAADKKSNISDPIIRHAIEKATPEVYHFLKHMPPQPKGEKGGKGKSRLSQLYADMDSALRAKAP
jgi:hypothetical protein